MQREPRAFLDDVAEACRRILEFTRGKSLTDYRAEVNLRSAVERQFEIVGEALAQLGRAAPELAARVPDVGKIVAFRNVLAHGYAGIDDGTVWEAVGARVPALLSTIEQLLRELGDADLR